MRDGLSAAVYWSNQHVLDGIVNGAIYALMALASALFVWKWVPETKGRTLEEMSKLWRKNGD